MTGKEVEEDAEGLVKRSNELANEVEDLEDLAVELEAKAKKAHEKSKTASTEVYMALAELDKIQRSYKG